jgi:hypothetical protein
MFNVLKSITRDEKTNLTLANNIYLTVFVLFDRTFVNRLGNKSA